MENDFSTNFHEEQIVEGFENVDRRLVYGANDSTPGVDSVAHLHKQ